MDSDLQIAVYNLLEQEIAGIVYSNIDNPSSDIPIPITDVYFALINNNVIDLSHFDSTDASTAEQSVSAIFFRTAGCGKKPVERAAYRQHADGF